MTSDVPNSVSSLQLFEEAAIEWAGTGHGQPLVDAAVVALLAGLDTPTLRVLAGVPARFADEESTDNAADTFDELGLVVSGKFTDDAYVALGKLKARRFLELGGSPVMLTTDLWKLYQDSNCRSELAEFSGLDDWYLMLGDETIRGNTAPVDEAVRESAQRLVAGLPSRGSRLGDAYMAATPVREANTSLTERVRSLLRFEAEPNE